MGPRILSEKRPLQWVRDPCQLAWQVNQVGSLNRFSRRRRPLPACLAGEEVIYSEQRAAGIENSFTCHARWLGSCTKA